MLPALLIHGAVVVLFLFAYGRWLDDEGLADICLFGLLFELAGATILSSYTSETDTMFFSNWGTVQTTVPSPAPSLTLSFDELSGFFFAILAFALVVCFYFLTEYFEYDAHASAIIYLSALFSQAAMLFFCSYDLALILALWEVISLISFFLVQHWAFSLTTYKAGLKVFTISQVGDFLFFCFFFLSLEGFGTTDLAQMLGMLPLTSFSYVSLGPVLVHLNTLLALTLSSALFLKAAQWFFYPWLLDAMEAPVPISAQLHSSTLVVIGFYLFFSLQPLYLLTPAAASVLLAAGVVTAVGASMLGFYQDDGKRLLACSTAGQLGYVVTSLGLGLYGEGLAMLTFCCCNKAFTFVWFGMLMRSYSGFSDFSVLGGLGGLTWAEHAGLLVAVANFTILPGAYAWHVKCLYMQGLTPTSPEGAALGLELLQFSWFFSTLYLGSLYLTLFLGARSAGQPQNSPQSLAYSQALQAKASTLSLLSTTRLTTLPWASLHTVSLRSLLVMWAGACTLLWYNNLAGMLVVDLTWASSQAGDLLSYY